LSFDFLHQGLSSGAVPLDFVDFLCSGTNVTTTRHTQTSSGKVDIAQFGLDRLGVAHFLTVPHLSLGLDQVFV